MGKIFEYRNYKTHVGKKLPAAVVCFKTIQDNYLIWFQYKILNRILGIESLKFKMGISQNNVCRLCNENEETLVHLFTLCNPVKKF